MILRGTLVGGVAIVPVAERFVALALVATRFVGGLTGVVDVITVVVTAVVVATVVLKTLLFGFGVCSVHTADPSHLKGRLGTPANFFLKLLRLTRANGETSDLATVCRKCTRTILVSPKRLGKWMRLPIFPAA
ncbi:hypothetical protein EDD21DRAFT_427166 [Dissophora ornata]|nr:hypothetical protein EDD21DRAFT_427166 [Dissophora ornata]